MRYSGKFGYAVSTEVRPGIWEDVITERDHIGDVVQRTEAMSVDSSINPVMRTTTSISVLSGGVTKESYDDIRYITYKGKYWSPSSVVEQPPRIIVYVGEVYNGPTAEPAPDAPE